MSRATFLNAAERLRATYDMFWPYSGRCGLCGHPDARHRAAEALTERLEAGDQPADLAADYNLTWDAHVWAVAFWTTASDRRRHGLTEAEETAAIDELYAQAEPRRNP